MKKILMVLVLSLVGFTNAFACESVFDRIDGITCELQYFLCSESNQDIKVCSKITKKAERFTKDIKEVDEKIVELERRCKELETDDEKARQIIHELEKPLSTLKKAADEAEENARNLYAEYEKAYVAALDKDATEEDVNKRDVLAMKSEEAINNYSKTVEDFTKVANDYTTAVTIVTKVTKEHTDVLLKLSKVYEDANVIYKSFVGKKGQKMLKSEKFRSKVAEILKSTK